MSYRSLLYKLQETQGRGLAEAQPEESKALGSRRAPK
jgi:hypothetical protein